MTLSQRATITAHYTPAIEAAETRLADAIEEFNAGYGEDYPGAIEDLRRSVADAREARAFALAN